MKTTDILPRYRIAADAVLAVLMDRGGFDRWWEGIDDETSTDIMNCIAAAIQEAV